MLLAVPSKAYRTLAHLKTRREVTREALRSEQRPSWRKIHTEALEIIARRIAALKAKPLICGFRYNHELPADGGELGKKPCNVSALNTWRSHNLRKPPTAGYSPESARSRLKQSSWTVSRGAGA
jgi:hypothetical protein